MKKRIFCALFAVMMLLVASLAQAAPAEPVDWNSGIITVEGYGTPPDRAKTPTKRFALARRAAIIDGYRALAETIRGVYVSSNSTVKDLEVESDIVKARVETLVQGARIVSQETLPDGGCKVVMQINMYGSSSSLADAIRPALEKEGTEVEPFKESIPSVTTTTTTNTSTTTTTTVQGNYTGVIIDCRDFEVNPIMSPVIRLQDGTPVYGYKNLNPDKVIHFGMAAYSHGQNMTQRAGSNPLVIHATGMERHNAYPVISDADANHMLAENKVSHFLDNCKVVIMRR